MTHHAPLSIAESERLNCMHIDVEQQVGSYLLQAICSPMGMHCCLVTLCTYDRKMHQTIDVFVSLKQGFSFLASMHALTNGSCMQAIINIFGKGIYQWLCRTWIRSAGKICNFYFVLYLQITAPDVCKHVENIQPCMHSKAGIEK